jgi:hypothetical protein
MLPDPCHAGGLQAFDPQERRDGPLGGCAVMKSRLGPPEMLHGATLPINISPAAARLAVATRLIRSGTMETKERKVESDTASDSDLIGRVIECFVCSWAGSAGFARAAIGTPGVDGKRQSLYFSSNNIITLGSETLKPGSRIRGLVCEPDRGRKVCRLREIEIFVDSDSDIASQNSEEETQ